MIKTTQEIKREFADRGLSFSGWAKKNNFSQALVYQVLSGKRKTLRGESHRIAIELGLKEGSLGDYDDLIQHLKNGEK